jgi:tetratricopeptide (TPR) repeat protein
MRQAFNLYSADPAGKLTAERSVNGKKEKYLVAALKFIERGQLDKALAEFAKVIGEDPTDTRTLLKMAELHAKVGQTAEATEIYLRTGEIYTEQGFAQKAVAVYKNALKLAPESAKAHLKLGMLLKQLGLSSDAVQQFELAASALQRDGAAAGAAEAYRQAVTVQPDNAVLRVKLAEAASLGGLVEEAVREFERAAEQLKAQGRVDESLRVLERLLFHQPANVAKARELAEAYLAKGNPRLALPKLQACLNGSPHDPRTLSLLARALEQLGQRDKAVSVLLELARLCHDLGRSADRDTAIARAQMLAPGDPEVQALALRHRGGAPGAIGEATPPPVSASGGSFDLGGAVGVNDTAASSGRIAVPIGIGDSGGVDMPPADGGPGSDVARILAESEVFVKYGLLERAADHLQRVFDYEPDNRTARERLAFVRHKLSRRAELVRHAELSSRPAAPAAAAPVSPPPGSVGLVLDVDDDPSMDVTTPPPQHDPGATPPPVSLAVEHSTDRVAFEDDVHTGDVVDVTDVGRRTVSLDWSEGPVTPPPSNDQDLDEDLEADLEQVAFFVEQGIVEEARALLDELVRRHPGHPAITAKLREVEAVEAREAAANLGTLPSVSPASGNMARRGSVSTPPPRAVVEAGGPPDVSTHLDLGIAYKEMGLFDAAITELKAVTEDPRHEVEALTMMGECYEAKGTITEAIIRYKGALNCTPISPDEMTQLYFLLGSAFDRLGDPSEALYFFEKVARRDPRFRDVDRRIAVLRPKLTKTAP